MRFQRGMPPRAPDLPKALVVMSITDGRLDPCSRLARGRLLVYIPGPNSRATNRATESWGCVKLEGLKHSSFRITTSGGTVVYFDPWELPDLTTKADLILISHVHRDHCSPLDVGALSHGETVVVAPQAAAEVVLAAGVCPPERLIRIQPGQKQSVVGIEITAVPAHNVNKFRAPGQPFHPLDPNFVGYLLTVDGTSIYFAGDTDVLAPAAVGVDVALVPVSGTYVMTAAEAARAVAELKPKRAVPMHYGTSVGSRADAEQFRDLLAPLPVDILH